MNIKQNKGYVGIDMSLAVMILLILAPTIMGIVFGINVSRNTADTKTQALNILVNTLETAKGIELEQLTEQKILEDFENDHSEYKLTLEAGNKSAIIATNKASFRLQVEVVDYHDINSEATENFVKTVTATVTYKAGNKENSLNLSTVVK